MTAQTTALVKLCHQRAIPAKANTLYELQLFTHPHSNTHTHTHVL